MIGRWLAIAHQLPERTRLRTPMLRRDPAACERLADELAAVPGVREVRIRPYTGSVLVAHDEQLAASTLAEVARRALDGPRLVAPGEAPPLDTEVPAFSTLARTMIATVRAIDRDIRRGSDGTVDLGTLATLLFVGSGVLKFTTIRRLDTPSWFNLVWWGFRTFTTAEQDAIHDHRDDAAAGS